MLCKAERKGVLGRIESLDFRFVASQDILIRALERPGRLME